MNEELRILLDNARASGANASQLQGIVDAYNLKKKDKPNGTGSAINGGEIGGIAGASKAQSVEQKVNTINNDEELSISSFKRRGQIPNAVKEAGGNAIVKTPEILFSGADKEGLKNLREKYNVTEFGFNPIGDIAKSEAFKALAPQGNNALVVEDNTSYRPYVAELTEAKSVEENLIAQLKVKKNEYLRNLSNRDVNVVSKNRKEVSELENDLRVAKTLRNKAAAELTIEGENEIDANISTNESGNLLNTTTNRLKTISQNPSIIASGLLSISQETSERIDKLPSQFVTGLNYLKNSEPVIFERITDALQKGLPISESQIATITQQGVELEQARFKRKLEKEEITTEDYSAKEVELNTVRKNNLLDNNETLRAFLSDGAANILDELGKKKNAAADMVNPVSSYAFGHTWNYDDKEIKYAAEQYAAKNGLDPQDGRIQKAIKYLQDNEGAMIMENSIAKAGGVRELFKGLAEPIRGISNSVEDLAKSSNDVYVESQSQGNTNVSEKRLKLEDTGIRGVVNDVVKGTGQFVTQAGIAYLTSGAVGGAGRAILGRAGVAALEGEIALADMSATNLIGKSLLGAKDGISTFITSYAQAYDSNLKNALSYTSDNQLAKQAASVNSALEGATELFLSPLDIAKGIGAKFASKGVTEDLLKVLSDKNLMKSPDKLKDFLSKTLKAVSGTAYVAGAEIGEEYVTQIADYVTNATLNPNSQTFQNRDLQNELSVTAYQTGLSMAIPALLNGIGAANANSFSKGSLLVAAQNRQKLIEGLGEDLALNNIDQDEYNEKAQIINTAAVANAELPLKADGAKLSTDEKADYIFSRTSEAVMKDKIEKSKDEAEKRILEGKIKTQQDFRIELLGTPTVIQQVVSDELATDAAITKTQQNSTPKTEIDIIPALKEKLTNVTVDNDAELLNYAIDKVAEAPTKLKTDLGDELFNQVLAQTPTEKLQEGLDFLINNNPDSEDVDVLDKIISEREAAATKIAQPKEQQVEEVKPPTSKSERLAAFKNKYVEPTQTTVIEQKQWSELSIQEKLSLAKENLPQVDNLSNVEAIKIADANAKMLLGKLNKPKVENENIQEPIQKADEGVTGSNEPITSKEGSVTKESNGENIQGKIEGAEQVEASNTSNVVEGSGGVGGDVIKNDKGEEIDFYHGTPADFQDFDMSKLGENTQADSAKEGIFFSNNKNVSESYRKQAEYDNPNIDGAVKELDKLTTEELISLSEKMLYGRSKYYYEGYGKKEIINDIIDDIKDDSQGFYQDRNKYIEKLQKELGQKGISFTPYIEQGKLFKVKLKMSNPFIYDAKEQVAEDIGLTKIIKTAKDKGHDGVIIKNTYDSVSFHEKGNDTEVSDIAIVFNPSQIIEQSLKETTKEETSTTNVGVEEGSGGVGGEKSILNSDTDLKGNKKQPFYQTKDEYVSKEVRKSGVSKRFDYEEETAVDDHKNFVDDATKEKTVVETKDGYWMKDNSEDGMWHKLDEKGEFIKDSEQDNPPTGKKLTQFEYGIKSGELTANDAKTIIESAGLEVPKDIVEQSLKETTKEETPISEEVKNEQITKLEEQRDAEIDEASKPNLKLTFVDEKTIPKEIKRDVMYKGKKISEETVSKEDLVKEHNGLKKRQQKLEDLIDCLTKKN